MEVAWPNVAGAAAMVALGLYLLIRSRALAEIEREVFRTSARILEFRMWSHRVGGALLLLGGVGLAASGVRWR